MRYLKARIPKSVRNCAQIYFLLTFDVFVATIRSISSSLSSYFDESLRFAFHTLFFLVVV